jgi:hypothetical protein
VLLFELLAKYNQLDEFPNIFIPENRLFDEEDWK